MAIISWLPAARDDLKRLYEFILPHSSEAAARAIDVILDSVDHLAAFPETGQFMGTGYELP